MLKVTIFSVSYIPIMFWIDDNGWLPWTYALYKGHIHISNLLTVIEPVEPIEVVRSPTLQPPPQFRVLDNHYEKGRFTPSSLFDMNGKDTSKVKAVIDDMYDIPSLSLPPPIIPFRI